jgi:hypothetical protein
MNKARAVAFLASVISLTGLIIGMLALINVVPITYVWGGRLTDRNELIIMEMLTFGVNLFIIWTVGMRVGYFRQVITTKMLRIIMAFLTATMLANTIGNLVAATTIEKFLAIPTFVGALCFLYLFRINPQ